MHHLTLIFKYTLNSLLLGIILFCINIKESHSLPHLRRLGASASRPQEAPTRPRPINSSGGDSNHRSPRLTPDTRAPSETPGDTRQDYTAVLRSWANFGNSLSTDRPLRSEITSLLSPLASLRGLSNRPRPPFSSEGWAQVYTALDAFQDCQHRPCLFHMMRLHDLLFSINIIGNPLPTDQLLRPLSSGCRQGFFASEFCQGSNSVTPEITSLLTALKEQGRQLMQAQRSAFPSSAADIRDNALFEGIPRCTNLARDQHGYQEPQFPFSLEYPFNSEDWSRLRQALSSLSNESLNTLFPLYRSSQRFTYSAAPDVRLTQTGQALMDYLFPAPANTLARRNSWALRFRERRVDDIYQALSSLTDAHVDDVRHAIARVLPQNRFTASADFALCQVWASEAALREAAWNRTAASGQPPTETLPTPQLRNLEQDVPPPDFVIDGADSH